MENVCISFENIGGLTPDDISKVKVRHVYDHINTHMILDINMDGKFTIKSILMDYAHTPAPESSSTYSRGVSRDSVNISFLLAPLNNL